MNSLWISLILFPALLCDLAGGSFIPECVQGKRWHANNTDYEVYGSKEPIVVAKCTLPGYYLVEPFWVPCVQGRLQQSLPQCKSHSEVASRTVQRHVAEYHNEVSCKELSAPSNGYMSCNETAPSIGSKCSFSCEPAYYLKGSRNRQCSIEGKWTGNEVRCFIREACPFPPPLHNGTVIGCSSINVPRFGSVCQFKCNDGFLLVGPKKLTCRITRNLTDEYGRVLYPKCHDLNDPCTTRNCSHYCRNHSGVARCFCHVGFRLHNDGKKCIKIEAKPSLNHIGQGWIQRNSQRLNSLCKISNGGCEHICDDSSGFIICKCKEGYHLSTDKKTCKNLLHTCALNNGGCSENCNDETGTVECSCKKGYKLLPDNRTCEDINECLSDNFKCSDGCENLPGSARCTCKAGFKLMEDGKHCIDVDECAKASLNKCDQKCHNTNGSYTCSCNAGYVPINDFKCQGCRINSYRSSSDTSCVDCPPNSHTDSVGKTSLKDCLCNDGFYGNITESEPCRDFDECLYGNFGCSNKCVNTPGSAHCICPQGFELQNDQKTCIDINECKVKNGGCQGTCHNSVGSFRCSCTEGYSISASDSYTCDDIDECQENNGGCNHECVNFPGGYHCSCPVGSQLGADGKSCHTLNCPGVAVPYYSKLRCTPKGDRSAKTNYTGGDVSKEFPVGTYCWLKCNKGYAFEEFSKTIECQSNGMWNDTLEECKVLECPPLEVPENGDVHPPECKKGLRTVKEKCYFTCNEGFSIEGKSVFQCKNKLQWDPKIIPKCVIEETIPFVTCPNDISVDLMPNESSANITIPSPESNVEQIEIDPDWAKTGQPVTFPAGKTDVVFIAKNPHFENLTSSCTMSVSVIDMESPTFLHCPSTFTISENSINGISELWVEPEAVDNVGIKYVTKTAEPISNWPSGIHTVEYIAEDLAGNIAKCSFEINVTSTECGDLDDPENGEANCIDWVYGKLCEPSCNANYTMDSNTTQFYVCDDTGTWSPSNVIPACLPDAECGFDEVWSEDLQQCVTITSVDSDTK